MAWPGGRLSTLAIGLTLFGAMLAPPGEGEKAFATRVAERVPLRRAGGASPVAAAVVFLLREDFATGVILPVDGGEYL